MVIVLGRGPGRTQQFILDELVKLPKGEWLGIHELMRRRAEDKGAEVTHSLDCAIRNSCRRLADPANPRIKLRWVGGKLSAQLTEPQRLRQTNPWELKRREMADTWVSILAEQSREIRKMKR